MAGRRNRVSSAAGFTLLELLVVMMIVAVAVAILYPVLSQVRERGRQTVCLTHVSQHARAVLMYADDYDERLPVAWNSFSMTATGEEALYPHWWNVVEPYMRNDEVFRCPEDGGYLGMRPGDPLDTQPFFPAIGSSYSSFLGWLPASDTTLSPAWPRMPGGLGGLWLTAVVNPTRAALSYDSWPYWHADPQDGRVTTASDTVLLNVSFLDGSARRRSIRYVSTYLAKGPEAAEETVRRVALGDLPQGDPASAPVRTASSTDSQEIGSKGSGKSAASAELDEPAAPKDAQKDEPAAAKPRPRDRRARPGTKKPAFNLSPPNTTQKTPPAPPANGAPTPPDEKKGSFQ